MNTSERTQTRTDTTTPSAPALQCCLLCRRTLTDREQHDKLEESVLAAIRAEHPEWAHNAAEGCDPFVAHYRALLRGRAARAEQPRRIRAIRSRRREIRRDKWSKSVKALAGALHAAVFMTPQNARRDAVL